MKKIVLVGCGNIGSRHLQALTKLSGQVVVDIVENYSKSIILAKSRLEETKYNEKYFKFNWHKDFQTLDGNSDLVIIATLSESRVILIEKLLKIGYSRFLIEKLVCQSTAEYKHLLKIITYPGRLLMSKKGFKFFIGRDPASFAGKGLFVLL